MEFTNPSGQRDCILTLERWLENRNTGKGFAEYFLNCGYKTIGICDASAIGRILYDELRVYKAVEVKWFIDKNAEGINSIDGIPVRLMKDIFELPLVDIVCVSPIYDYGALSDFLISNNPKISTLSLKDAAYEC